MNRPTRPLSLVAMAACGFLTTLAFPGILGPGNYSTPNGVISPPPVDAKTLHEVPSDGYRVLAAYPHDRAAFTQGLVFEDGFLYEGTGLNGHSSLRKVALETGAILKRRDLPAEFFGEGITIYRNRIIQLTWQSHVGFLYDKDSFKLIGKFSYPTEGWGITHDERRLIVSDGTATLHFLDPETFAEIGRIEVCDRHGKVFHLNELEYVKGEIYANVWQTDRIARISPASGRVIGWIDLVGLLGPKDCENPVDVLNGIAYDAKHDRLFVTGKFWPRLFQVDPVAPK